MHKKTKKKKNTERKLGRLRRIVYTTLSLAIIESSGIFALAKTGLLYVQSNAVTNAFSPKTFVDIEVTEPNGQKYYITTDNKTESVGGDGTKEAYVTNPGTEVTKKPVVARAKIVAVICDKDGVEIETVEKSDSGYALTSGTIITSSPNTADKWYQVGDYYYYTSVLEPGDNSESLFKDVKLAASVVADIPDEGYVTFHVMVDTIEIDTAKTETAVATNNAYIQENWGQPESGSDLWKDYFTVANN